MAFVGIATAATSTPGTSQACNTPPGVLDGHVMLTVVVWRSNSATLTAPGGWMEVLTDPHSGGALQMSIWRRVASSEPASYTWSISSAFNIAIACGAWSGRDTTTPINASGSQENASSTSITAPSITTNVDGCDIVYAGCRQGSSGFTPDAAFTERSDHGSTDAGSNVAMETADRVQATLGATGTATATHAGAALNIGAQVALAPAAAGHPPMRRRGGVKHMMDGNPVKSGRTW